MQLPPSLMVPDRHVIGQTQEIETTGEPGLLLFLLNAPQTTQMQVPPYPCQWHQTSSLLLTPSALPYQMALSIEGASSSHPALPHRMTLYLLLLPLAFQTTWTDPSLPLPLNKQHQASSPSLTSSTLPCHSMLSVEDASPGTYHPQC